MWNNVGMIIGNFVAMLIGIGVLYGVVSLSDSPNFERYRDFIGKLLIGGGILGIALAVRRLRRKPVTADNAEHD